MQNARTFHPSEGAGRLGRFRLSLLLASAVFAGAVPAGAQSLTDQPPGAAVSPDAVKQREKELEAVRQEQQNALAAQQKIKADIAAIGEDRAKLNQRVIEIASQVRTVEGNISDAEGRLRTLDQREDQLRGSLTSRRSEVVEVLAALQRAGRRSPPALLIRPDDALQSLRTAMLFGAVVPDLRARAERLATDLGELVALRKSINEEHDRLAIARDSLKSDQVQLAALIEQRQRKQAVMEKDMEAEGARAVAFAKQIDDLQGLISKMEQDVRSAARAAASATLQGAPAPPSGKPDLAALRNPGRQSPAIAFASAKGMFSFPVNGTKIHDFGASDGAGGIEKGISLAARAGAQVTTPCDGWVVYAGPFRSYGQLLILNAGGGYHVLIAGMERISVNIGQFVQTGEPVATMGSTSQVASILAANAGQPVLYVEFRKDGTPIDPGPWWAANEGEKVRG
ncbi:MAG: peptidoglycan DD-metalloendopeptidase family protein [Bradyrhizobium sp.]|uniref:murein hydrolase activator EnvC family protein n=1 Tax=Bradyrhizobium sp. TaxID=376 RepID=UPI001D82869E|nr:peptidoglycan DD-metalloendopeptidase family protein [Bradyrhizobium sp.]MBV9559273.1 peptidoglycan DD-metalloendopeptidase family protein [Bradyrhizobium sp.]